MSDFLLICYSVIQSWKWKWPFIWLIVLTKSDRRGWPDVHGFQIDLELWLRGSILKGWGLHRSGLRQRRAFYSRFMYVYCRRTQELPGLNRSMVDIQTLQLNWTDVETARNQTSRWISRYVMVIGLGTVTKQVTNNEVKTNARVTNSKTLSTV